MPRRRSRLETLMDKPSVYYGALFAWAAIVAYLFWVFDPDTAARWAQAF